VCVCVCVYVCVFVCVCVCLSVSVCAKHHGVSPSKFLLYIKEMEWRYNNRDEDTFSLLLDYMLRGK